MKQSDVCESAKRLYRILIPVKRDDESSIEFLVPNVWRSWTRVDKDGIKRFYEKPADITSTDLHRHFTETDQTYICTRQRRQLLCIEIKSNNPKPVTEWIVATFFSDAYFEVTKDKGYIYLPIDVGFKVRNDLNSHLYEIGKSFQTKLQLIISQQGYNATIQVLGTCYNKTDNDYFKYDDARPAKLPKPQSENDWERLASCIKLDFLNVIEHIAKAEQDENCKSYSIDSGDVVPPLALPFRLYLPSNLSPDIVKSMLPDNLKKKFWLACWIINTLVEQYYHWQRKEDGWVHLKSSYWGKVVTHDLLKIKKTLLDSGIMTTNNRYIEGKESIGYWFGEQYDIDNKALWTEYNGRAWKDHIVGNERLSKKMSDFRDGRFEKDSKVLKHLNSWLRQLDFSYAQALGHLKQLEELNQLKSDESYEHNEMAICKLRDRQWEFSHDWLGRVHTNLTRLHKQMRRYLKIGNQRLYNVDIKNSQPLFLCTVISRWIREYEPEQWVDPTTQEFIEICESGKFYESMMHRLDITDRDAMKKLMYKHVFFGPIRTEPYKPKDQNDEDAMAKYKTLREDYIEFVEISEMFKTHHPQVWKIIYDIKGGEHGQYENLAHMLQRAESSFVIDTICHKIMTDKPDVPILTIHDSIMTTYHDTDYVRRLLVDGLKKLGLNVSGRIVTVTDGY